MSCWGSANIAGQAFRLCPTPVYGLPVAFNHIIAQDLGNLLMSELEVGILCKVSSRSPRPNVMGVDVWKVQDVFLEICARAGLCEIAG